MPYAFVSHESALEALRALDTLDGIPVWPTDVRLLPIHGDCICNQSAFRAFASEVDLAAHGIRTKPVDLLVPHASMRSRGQSAKFHVWRGVLPQGGMLRIADQVLVSSPAFVMAQMAGYHPRRAPIADHTGAEIRGGIRRLAELGIDESPIYDPDPMGWELTVRQVEIIKVACELLGTYRRGSEYVSTRYGLAPLMARQNVDDLIARHPTLFGKGRIQRAMERAFDRSASPREMALALMLTLPADMGGFGLPKPALNVTLDVWGREVVHIWQEEIVPDLLWKERALVVEYDSDEFHAAAGQGKLAEDAARSNALAASGYTVLRATTETVSSLGELELLARQVATVLGETLPEVDAVGRLRRERLHALLMR